MPVNQWFHHNLPVHEHNGGKRRPFWKLRLQGYLLVLPAVGGKGVVLHLHGEVQPGEGVTQPHPERRGIAGHCRHGGHFLPVLSSSLHEGQKWCQCEQDIKYNKKEGKKGLRRSWEDWNQWGLIRDLSSGRTRCRCHLGVHTSLRKDPEVRHAFLFPLTMSWALWPAREWSAQAWSW